MTTAGGAARLLPVLLVAGCSLALTRPVSTPADPRLYPDCDAPTAAIAGDVLAALGGGALAVGLASGADALSPALVSGAVGAVFGLSAVRGMVVHAQCSSARAAYEARLNLQPLGPPPPPPRLVIPPPPDAGADARSDY